MADEFDPLYGTPGEYRQSDPSQELGWLGAELRERPMLGVSTRGVRSHGQDFLSGPRRRNTCVVAASQNADRLVRGSGSRFQRMSTDQVIALLSDDPFREHPEGLSRGQLLDLISAMELDTRRGVDAGLFVGSLPLIGSVLKQGGVVIEHGGPEQHSRVIANVHRPADMPTVRAIDIARAAQFSILDSASHDGSPYDIPVVDFMDRLVRFGPQLSYLGVKLPQAEREVRTRVRIIG